MRISDWSSDVCSSDLVHYRIVTTLHDEGRLSDGAYMEFLQTHTNVVYQPMFDTPGYNGINPYALGFGMMTDIERICTDPTEEDREWFPDIAGSKERSEEHTSELQSLMRISYAVFCLKKNNKNERMKHANHETH